MLDNGFSLKEWTSKKEILKTFRGEWFRNGITGDLPGLSLWNLEFRRKATLKGLQE